MAHTGLFATSDEIIVRAGENYDTSITEARINALCKQAESFINCMCKYNFSDWFSAPATTTKNADVWYLLSVAEATFCAMSIIAYNPAAYSSLGEAQTLLDVNRDEFIKAIELLQTKVVQDFMIGA